MHLPQLVQSTLQIFSELIRTPNAQIKSMLSFLRDLFFFPVHKELSLLITLNVQGCRMRFLDLTKIGTGSGTWTTFQPRVAESEVPWSQLGGCSALGLK